jgi:membrane-associated phospholipid phosphatase
VYVLSVWMTAIYVGEHYAFDVFAGAIYSGATYALVIYWSAIKPALSARARSAVPVSGIPQ